MKSVLISIQPKWCELIASGEKTIEVRKTRPKLQTPFKCYIYDTKGIFDITLCLDLSTKSVKVADKGRGKVIGEFMCDRIMRFTKHVGWLSDIQNYDISYDHLKETCLEGLWQYGKGKPLYGWHITDLKIYDKPKELGEFYRPVKYNADGPICGTEKEMQDIIEWDCETVFDKESTECTLKDCPKLKELYKITRPYQSWGYVEA